MSEKCLRFNPVECVGCPLQQCSQFSGVTSVGLHLNCQDTFELRNIIVIIVTSPHQ